MSIKAGLVGLPNVGKSTLFNALTKAGVPAENYPFCTIDPHMAITEVPDERIGKLQELYKSQEQIPATVSFVDIAGLVKGAASGEGLGNQFLSHIREVDLILHVLRAFEDENIIHTSSELDPIDDFKIINEELMLKDLDSVTKRIEKIKHSMKAAQQKPALLKDLQAELTLMEQAHKVLNAGDIKGVREVMQQAKVTTIPLLTAKKFLIIANVSEHEIDDKAYEKNANYKKLIEHFGAEKVIPICAKLEFDLSQLSDQEAQEMMGMWGLEKRGLDTIIKNTYKNLGLITFFTCGPKEIHAWPIPKGMTIRKAAGEIHSDLERGFICAEIFNYKDLIELGSIAALKSAGKVRTEGQDYVVQDGDIVLVKFNV